MNSDRIYEELEEQRQLLSDVKAMTEEQVMELYGEYKESFIYDINSEIDDLQQRYDEALAEEQEILEDYDEEYYCTPDPAFSSYYSLNSMFV